VVRCGAFERIEDVGREDVPADDRVTRRCLIRFGFFDHSANRQDAFIDRIGRNDAVLPGLLPRHFLNREDRMPAALEHPRHLEDRRHVRVDDVVSQHHGERLIADEIFGLEDRVAQAQGEFLPDVDDFEEIRDLPNQSEQILLAAVLEHSFELEGYVEVVFDGILAPAGDQDDLLDAGGLGFLDDVLNERLVDERKHFFWLRLGGRQETGAEAGRGKDGFADPHDEREDSIKISGVPAAAKRPGGTLFGGVCVPVDEVFFSELSRDLQERGRLVLATVVAIKGSGPARVGRRMLFFGESLRRGTVGGGPFEALVALDAQELLGAQGRRTLLKWYDFFDTGKGEPTHMVCGGSAQVFLELLQAAPQLAIVGGGHVGLALARSAVPLGFEVSVWDDRAEYSDPKRFPECARVAQTDRGYGVPEGMIRAGRDLYMAIVTRCWETDLAALRQALAPDAPAMQYLGVIGSARKLRLVFEVLQKEGVDTEKLRRIRAPIGLPIGAVTPEEIAVSILGEIVAVRRGLSPETVPATPISVLDRA
jgi:xanthine dehydrogenase accessory factor